MHFLAKRRYDKETKQRVQVAAYIVGVGGNLAVIPQLLAVWNGPAPGLAILTWILFICFGLIWLLYAIVNNQKPLIITQLLGLTFNTLVVVGYFLNQ